MRSIPLCQRLAPFLLAAVTAALGCKTSTASGGPSSSADAGTADGGGSVARDVGQGAGTAAGTVASGVEAAGRGVADAGAAAYGAASGAATTAADAARDAAAGAKAGAASAMDGGSAAATAAMDAGSAAASSAAGAVADAGASATATSPPLSDAQIAAIAVTANKVDIDAARLARRRSKNAQVKRFAADMIRDHTSANKQAAALAQKLGVTPEENAMSRSIAQDGENNLSTLRTMKGKQFDRAYAEHEVGYHQQVLAALDEKLIPATQNAELKSLLQSVRAVVAQHLSHAEQLMGALSR